MLMRKNSKLALGSIALASMIAVQASAETSLKKAQVKTPQTPLSTRPKASTQKAPSANSTAVTPSTTTSAESSATPSTNSATAAGTSTASTSKSNLEKVKEYGNLQLSNEISGMTVETPDAQKLESNNKVTIAYRTGKWRLGPVIQFKSAMTGAKLTDHFDILDPYLRAANVSLFNNGNTNLFADLRYYVPATQAAQDKGLIGSVRTTQVLSYTVPNSRVTALLIGIGRVWGFHTESVADDSKYVQLMAMPGVAYQLTPSIALSGYYGAFGNLKESAGGKSAAWSYDDLIDLGVEFSVGNFLTINPYVEFTPYAGISAKSTTYQATVNWNLL